MGRNDSDLRNLSRAFVFSRKRKRNDNLQYVNYSNQTIDAQCRRNRLYLVRLWTNLLNQALWDKLSLDKNLKSFCVGVLLYRLSFLSIFNIYSKFSFIFLFIYSSQCFSFIMVRSSHVGKSHLRVDRTWTPPQRC